jgi:hypothetical protein
MNFFAWINGVLADPADQQGSTKRVCLMIFMLVLVTLLVVITCRKGDFPIVPDSFLNLVYFVVGSFLGGMSLDKGIAAVKQIKGGIDDANTGPALGK